jgi:ketosteroid isomerase-like protein
MATMMSAVDVVHMYTQALDERDFSAARALLADDLRFEGPIDHFEQADDFIKTISGLYGMVTAVEHKAFVAEAENVAWFYVLNTPVANAPIAEWHTVRAGKIVQIRAYFDARPFAHS